MRANPFQIIVLAGVSAVAPAAWAHSHRPAAKPVATSRKASAHERAAAPLHHGRKISQVEPVHLARGKHAQPPATKRVLLHGKWHTLSAEPAGNLRASHPAAPALSRHGKGVPLAVAPKFLAKATPAPAPRTENAAAPEPEPQQDLAPVHVVHDRKQHFSAPAASDQVGSEQEAPDQPRKATTADFLSVNTPAVPVPSVKTSAPIVRVSPTAGVNVGAKVDVKPEPLPVKQLAPQPLVSLAYDRRGRLIVPAPMKGSHEVLVHQNVMANSDGLERIQDDEDLLRMRTSHMLVALPENDGLQTDERLPANRRYTRPWTASFLTALARAHYARFHAPLQVNSAVRTVEFQVRLIRTNGNAAPAEGETASPHLTGQAVDIAKHGLSLTEIAWLRAYLLPLVQEGKVDVEEEFQQACFHISVYKKYAPVPAGRRSLAEAVRTQGSALAVVLP